MQSRSFSTPTCIIRRAESADAPSIARHANDFAIWSNLRDAFPHPYTLVYAQQYVKALHDQEPPTNFAIEAGGEVVGCIGLKRNADVERYTAEIGYWIGGAFWGRGIATDAVRIVSRYGLEDLNLQRVYALPFARNTASCRVLAKAGFIQEGVMRKAAVKNGEILDLALFALTR